MWYQAPCITITQVDKLRELAARHGVTVVERPSQVPEDLMATCMEQLGRHYDLPYDPVTTQGYHWHEVRMIC